MAGIDQRFVGQAQQLVEQRIVGGAWVTVLEIGAAGAADQEGVAGEDPVLHQEAVGFVRVARRVDGPKADPLDVDVVAVRDPDRNDVGLALPAHDGRAAGPVAQGPQAGDVVGVDVGVQGLDQLEV